MASDIKMLLEKRLFEKIRGPFELYCERPVARTQLLEVLLKKKLVSLRTVQAIILN